MSLRVCFALPGLHRVNRGAEAVLEEVAQRAAANHGIDVTLIGSGQPREGQPYRFIKGRCIRREFFEKYPKIPYARDHYAWEELSFAPSLFWKYEPREYDVTVTCGYPYSNWLLRRGRKAGRPKHVFVTQNGDWMVHANNWEFKHFSCDGLVCTNPEYFERNKERYPSALIPNGVDTAKFFVGTGDRAALGLPANAKIVLIVAALIPSKRVAEGVRAVAGADNLHLVVAGDGEQRDIVDGLGKELLGERYRRLTLPRPKMPELYRCADVLLHMSQDEPFGNIYIEALASGLPVVAHETAVTRWITEDQARLVDANDISAVSRALEEAIADKGDEKRSARRALVERRFSWDAVAVAYCEFFRQIGES